MSSTDENVYLLCLTIYRKTLIKDLKNVLDQDELHLIQILLHVKIAAKWGHYKVQFSAETPQGDCASASEFTFYLAKSLGTTIANDTSSLE